MDNLINHSALIKSLMNYFFAILIIFQFGVMVSRSGTALVMLIFK
jgi:hypothetical protein